MSFVPPVRREVLVDADPATAFEVFTGAIGGWWPLAELGVYGAGATVAFVDGELVERSTDGETSSWGSVTRWVPSVVVAFTWHPGREPAKASQVEVTFTAAGDQTLVTLEHTGWDGFDDPLAARNEYDKGWPGVLGLYQDRVNQSAVRETWVALVHRPGPVAPPSGSVFDDPRFADHLAFLARMHDAGYLVAAGPLTDEPGEGMAILRLPGPDQGERATRLATEEDASVASGLFTVTVRPWRVMLQA